MPTWCQTAMHPTNFLSRRLREVWSTVRVAIERASNGLLYLTNKYVVPSRRFNEMYGTVNSSSAACCAMGE